MPADFPLWIKAFHIIAVLFWMAGLFYLPRLFAYHAETDPSDAQWETFCRMERRLANIIMTPSMIVAWVLGLILVSTPGVVDFLSLWMYAKLALVVLLTWMHALCLQWRRVFAEGRVPHSRGFFRLVNELPPLLAAGVVVLVVVRPF